MHQVVTAANRNLFTRVVLASEDEGPKGLSDEEITGNLFIYLLAGVNMLPSLIMLPVFMPFPQHETTASTLAATLALLALHQDEQQRIHEHIISVVGDRDIVSDLATNFLLHVELPSENLLVSETVRVR